MPILGSINMIDNANEKTIFIYSAIGGGGREWGEISNQDIADELKDFTGNHIILRINSRGGQVFEAVGIYNYLLSLKKKITVYIDGQASSAASLIAMVGDHIVMAENGMMLIHQPSAIAWGTFEELRAVADELEQTAQLMKKTYAARLKDASRIDEIYKSSDTQLNADQCFDYGLCDEITRIVMDTPEDDESDDGTPPANDDETPPPEDDEPEASSSMPPYMQSELQRLLQVAASMGKREAAAAARPPAARQAEKRPPAGRSAPAQPAAKETSIADALTPSICEMFNKIKEQ